MNDFKLFLLKLFISDSSSSRRLRSSDRDRDHGRHRHGLPLGLHPKAQRPRRPPRDCPRKARLVHLADGNPRSRSNLDSVHFSSACHSSVPAHFHGNKYLRVIQLFLF